MVEVRMPVSILDIIQKPAMQRAFEAAEKMFPKLPKKIDSDLSQRRFNLFSHFKR